MNKAIVFCVSLLLAMDAYAGVRMLGSSGSRSGGSSASSGITFNSRPTVTQKITNARQWCLENGYEATSCEGNVGVVVTCPKNSHYVHCCPPKYRFRKEFCESKGYIPSEDDCMGYYRCMVPVATGN